MERWCAIVSACSVERRKPEKGLATLRSIGTPAAVHSELMPCQHAHTLLDEQPDSSNSLVIEALSPSKASSQLKQDLDASCSVHSLQCHR